MLDSIEAVRCESDDESKFLDRCEDVAIYYTGQRRRNQRSGDDADGDADAPQPWPLYTAQSLSKVGLQIQKELLDEKIYSYIVEWCETLDRRKPGVAYSDVTVLYDVSGANVSCVSAAPTNNIYIRIPHPLSDPVLQSAYDILDFGNNV